MFDGSGNTNDLYEPPVEWTLPYKDDNNDYVIDAEKIKTKNGRTLFRKLTHMVNLRNILDRHNDITNIEIHFIINNFKSLKHLQPYLLKDELLFILDVKYLSIDNKISNFTPYMSIMGIKREENLYEEIYDIPDQYMYTMSRIYRKTLMPVYLFWKYAMQNYTPYYNFDISHNNNNYEDDNYVWNYNLNTFNGNDYKITYDPSQTDLSDVIIHSHFIDINKVKFRIYGDSFDNIKENWLTIKDIAKNDIILPGAGIYRKQDPMKFFKENNINNVLDIKKYIDWLKSEKNRLLNEISARMPNYIEVVQEGKGATFIGGFVRTFNPFSYEGIKNLWAIYDAVVKSWYGGGIRKIMTKIKLKKLKKLQKMKMLAAKAKMPQKAKRRLIRRGGYGGKKIDAKQLTKFEKLRKAVTFENIGRGIYQPN